VGIGGNCERKWREIAPASASPAAKPAQDIASTGLTSDEARTRLEKDVPNAMPDTSAHPLRNALAKFWAPVPWLLEASTVLELVLHKYYEAAVIAALLIFNAALAYFQESRAQATLAALKSRLALDASASAMEPGRLFRPRNWYVAIW
jgi:H+-transporting ATPase